MARPYWEEMGFSTLWYYDRDRMRRERLSDAELARIIGRHGELATAELAMLAGSGNFNNYLGALERINAAPQVAAPEDGLPLFAAR